MSPTVANPLSHLPSTMRQLPQWMCRDGQKRPCAARTGRLADCTDRANLATFDEAQAAVSSHGLAGLSFALFDDDGLVGLDFDPGRDNDGTITHPVFDESGAVHPEVEEIAKNLGGYCERSPSGDGLRIFTRGEWDGKCRATLKCGVTMEVYGAKKVLSVTGDVFPLCTAHAKPMRDASTGLRWLKDRYHLWRRSAAPTRTTTQPEMTNEEVISRVRQKFGSKAATMLDEGRHPTKTDQSAIDFSLACMLASFTSDETQIRELFDSSALRRDKHREPRGNTDWLGETIRRAVEETTTVYTGTGDDEVLASLGPEVRRAFASHAASDPFPGMGQSCNDSGNARRFWRLARGWAFYCYDDQTWYIWNGSLHVPDRANRIVQFVALVVLSIMREADALDARADALGNDAAAKDVRRDLIEAADRLRKWAKSSGNDGHVRATLKLAASLEGMHHGKDELNSNPLLVHCKNGTLEFEGDGTYRLREHHPDDLITRTTGIDFDADARHPLVERFFTETFPDEAEREFAQRHAGYSLSGYNDEDVILYAGGLPATGKSTWVGLLRTAFGDYAATADSENFVRKRNDVSTRSGIARLQGARLVFVVEVDHSRELATALLSGISGGDEIEVREIYEKPRAWRPTFGLVIVANDDPRIPPGQHGLWRRLLKLLFRHQVAEQDRDPTVRADLTNAEVCGPAALAWVVRGMSAYLEGRAKGVRRLDPPASVIAATAEYHDDENPVPEFIETCCEVGDYKSLSDLPKDAHEPEFACAPRKLWQAFEFWREREGRRTGIKTARELVKAIQAEHPEIKRSEPTRYRAIVTKDGKPRMETRVERRTHGIQLNKTTADHLDRIERTQF